MFKNCKFVNCDMVKAFFVDCAFEACDLSNVDMHEASFIRVKFSNCRLVREQSHLLQPEQHHGLRL